MAADKIKLAKEGVEAFSAGDWARVRATLSPDSVYEELATQRRIQGPDAIVEANKGWRKAFPNARGTVHTAIESGDTVVLEITWEGTQTGELVGPQGTIAPSGKRAKVPAVQLLTFRNDKIVENKHYFDLMTILVQIGALPTPATA